MKHNPNSIYERPPADCPSRCASCRYFRGTEVCQVNGCTTVTDAYSNPQDRPLPAPLSCPWWYTNRVLNTVKPDRLEQIKEERWHLITAHFYMRSMKSDEDRVAFIEHLHRAGGCGRIDFVLYPEAAELYNMILQKDSNCPGRIE